MLPRKVGVEHLTPGLPLMNSAPRSSSVQPFLVKQPTQARALFCLPHVRLQPTAGLPASPKLGSCAGLSLGGNF